MRTDLEQWLTRMARAERQWMCAVIVCCFVVGVLTGLALGYVWALW